MVERFTHSTIFQLTQWLSHDAKVSESSIQALQQEESYLPLFALANKFWLLGALVYQFKVKAVWQHLPEEVQQYLNELEQAFTQRSRFIQQEIQLCAQLLSNEQIPCLLLKGAASINNGTYQDISERFMADIDILVTKEHIYDAQAVLKLKGFSEKPLPYDLSPKNHHHLPPLIRENGLCYVELHHQSLKAQNFTLLSNTQVWHQATDLWLTDTLKVKQLSPTDQMVTAIAHSEISNGNFDEGILELRQLHNIYSIAHTFKHEINWKLLKEKFSLVAKEPVLSAVIYKLATLFKFECELTKRDDYCNDDRFQQSLNELVASQRKNKVFTETVSVLKGYRKDSILNLYGGNKSWALFKGRMKHLYRHLCMALKKILPF